MRMLSGKITTQVWVLAPVWWCLYVYGYFVHIGTNIYNNKTISSFDQMPAIHNIPESGQILDIFMRRTLWSTYTTEEDLLFEYQKISVNDKNIPPKEKIPSKKKIPSKE